MRMMTCEKRQATEDAAAVADASSALGRLAELSNQAKRVKRSPIKNADEFHNMVTFSQYYNDEFHSESESDDGGGLASDYSTGKDVDSEDSPPIELEIQEIRVTKTGKSAFRSRSRRTNSEKSKKNASVAALSKEHGSPRSDRRFTQSLRELSKTLALVMKDFHGDEGCDTDVPSFETIQDDPSTAMDELNLSLATFRQSIQTVRAPPEELEPVLKPGLEQLWETAQKLSRQEARMNLACWRTAAGEMRTQLQEALVTHPSGEHTALFERCLDFMSSVSLCNLVRDESTDIRDMAVHESSTSMSRSIQEQDVARFEAMAIEVRELVHTMRADAAMAQATSSPPSPRPVKVEKHRSAVKHQVPTQDDDDRVRGEPGCAVCLGETGEFMACDNGCGKEYHAACLELDGPPDEGSWYCPPCMESLGLSGDGQVFMCAALHCKRISVTRYCAVHSCRFKGCNFRLRGRGYCRRHDTHQKRSLALQ
ncbi:Aste57867_11056 [Aphanomyces stellatus]|uniref:Aste57867_11056 protein n=1 Tax=Aphanomyces stellatus TaxID=120398 RepID=A0A485KTT3_9STRA|nr:hypothetical protein As57867_011014 [Aphanomyces stellatus]VFT87924.1 Aste57867_11056 [Aphanomyces stellatus]